MFMKNQELTISVRIEIAILCILESYFSFHFSW